MYLYYKKSTERKAGASDDIIRDKNLAGFEYLSKKIYSPEQFSEFDEYLDAVVIAVTRQRYVDEIKTGLRECEVKTKRVITLGGFRLITQQRDV